MARTNLLDEVYIKHDNSDDSSSCESLTCFDMEELIDIQEIHPSISSCSLESFQFKLSENSSKTNLVVPNSSTASINDDVRKLRNIVSTLNISKNINVDRFVREDCGDLPFTRSQLMRRLNNLVKMSYKNFNGDVEVRKNINNFLKL